MQEQFDNIGCKGIHYSQVSSSSDSANNRRARNQSAEQWRLRRLSIALAAALTNASDIRCINSAFTSMALTLSHLATAAAILDKMASACLSQPPWIVNSSG